jgi:hypothetical protein
MEYQQLLFNDTNNCWFSFATIVGLTLQYLLVEILTVLGNIQTTVSCQLLGIIY